MFQKTENSSAIKPDALEIDGKFVFVRKAFKHIPEDEDRSEHWEYDEWQMTTDQYDVYQQLQGLLKEQEDALVELAELISEVM